MDLDQTLPSLPEVEKRSRKGFYACSERVECKFTSARSFLIRLSRSSQLDAYGLDFFVSNDLATSDAN